MSDCETCSAKTDIEYIRESIDEVKENTKNQWRYINRNALKITKIQAALALIIPLFYALIKFLPRG